MKKRPARDIAAARYKVGGVSFYAQLDRTQAVADRYTDSAALFQALGGGWWKEE